MVRIFRFHHLSGFDFYPMIISSRRLRRILALFSLVPMFASSAASATTVSFMTVAENSYTSTSPIVSRSWEDFTMDNVTETVTEKKTNEPAIPPTLKTDYVDITAYRAVMEECDSDPLVTADGSVVTLVENILAANHLPFGTKLRIPDYFGDRVFEVRDRMNTRYTKRIDILMTDPKAVNQWGIKRKAKIEIIAMGTNAHQWNDPEMKMARKQLAMRQK